jgi:chaperone protein EcpD
LQGNANDAAAHVRWKFVRKDKGNYVLEATNPTPYHVTFSQISVMDGATNWTNDKGGMLDPGASATFDLGNIAPRDAVPAQVDYTFINDYGAGVSGKSLRDGTRK